MPITKKQLNLIEWIVFLLVISYMVVTVILKDFILVRFLRDILLLVLAGNVLWRARFKITEQAGLFGLILFLMGLVFGVFLAPSVGTAFTVARRYLFPVLLLIAVSNVDFREKYDKFFLFICVFYTVLSLFGIFQAQVLGDGFLRNLGYPVEYSPFYKRDMLYNSFYFGGLGIQRVVATLSSSNICALLTGTALLCMILTGKYVNKAKALPLVMITVALGFLLSVSRSNILALLIVLLFIGWPYIPYKKYILIGGVFLLLAVILLGIYQGEDGILYKLFQFAESTFNMTDTSAAGRSGIWKTALEQVMKSPFGIGLGHVGGLATQHGVEFKFSAENSYLAMALDTGWIGLFGYVAFLLAMMFKIRKSARNFKKERNFKAARISTMGYAMILYLMIVMFFSNHIHDMEAVSMVYIYVGIALSYMRYEKKNRLLTETP